MGVVLYSHNNWSKQTNLPYNKMTKKARHWLHEL